MIKSGDAAAWRPQLVTPESLIPDYKIAPYFGVSKHVIKRWGQDGKIPVHRYKTRGRRYRIGEVSRFVENDLPRILKNQPNHSKGNWRPSKRCADPNAPATLYGIFDPKDNQCVYVGYTVNRRDRWADHRNRLRKGRHTNQQLQRLWDKRGKLNFKVLQTGMAGIMFHAEVEAIARLRKEIGQRLCNATAGGDGASGMSRGVRARLSEIAKAKWQDPEYRKRHEAATGHKYKGLQAALLYRLGVAMRDVQRACTAAIPKPRKLKSGDFVWPTQGHATFVPLTKGLWAAIPTTNAAWAKAQCKWCAQTHNGKPRPKANVRGGGAVIMPQPWRVLGQTLTKPKRHCHFDT